MPDWNGDGKDDFHDDYTYHEVFNTRRQPPAQGKSSGGWAWKLLIAVIVWELLNLLAELTH